MDSQSEDGSVVLLINNSLGGKINCLRGNKINAQPKEAEHAHTYSCNNES
jgi:hypothetical protein